MTKLLTPAQVKAGLHDGEEIALLDVREQGQFGEAHLFYAVPLPYSRIELDAPRLVPRRSTRVVVYDDGSADGNNGGTCGVAERAATRLAAMGYTGVHLLAGGSAAWAAAGLRLFQGVNLPSKTFGELVEQQLHTPRIAAAELARRQAAGDKLVVLDGRPFGEYRKMNIPGAICCPNGELVLRIGELAPDPTTTVVINCAGRTRSIIGAQTLINFGIPNPVLALENGTQGWYLADFELQHGSTRRHGDNAAPVDLIERRARAAALAVRHGVPTVDAEQARRWLADPTRNCFVLDVRTAEEFAAGTLAGAQHAPGGQLLQATDQYVGVRHARLLLADSDGVRAPVVASWLRQMGWDASVLRDGIAAPLSLPAAEPCLAEPLQPLEFVDAATLATELDARRVAAIDLRPGMAYRGAHVPRSTWSIRPRLATDAKALGRPVVLIADEPALAQLAAVDLQQAGLPAPRLLAGGLQAWRDAGLPVEASPGVPSDTDCIDYLFFVHDRHDGNKDAARRYLSWETGLIAQLDEQERSALRIA
ncbi:MAG TPA: rhodanese-like domain-containing protein [Ideonella sp.]|nr:rhodanese-like domain-containing protein [Ideonella sp.]